MLNLSKLDYYDIKHAPEIPIGCTSVVFPGTVMSSKTLILADLHRQR